MAKKDVLQFKYDSDKLRAIRMTMKEKGLDFDEEIMGTIEKMYDKFVPNTLKNFIESNNNTGLKR